MLASCFGDGEARADGQGRELIDRVAAGAPVRELFFVEAIGHTRMPRITAPGSRREQSTRMVQQKRRPTLNVESMIVLRARDGGTGSRDVTLRGGVRRVIPFLLVRSGGCARSSILCGQTAKRSCLHAYCQAAKGGLLPPARHPTGKEKAARGGNVGLSG